MGRLNIALKYHELGFSVIPLRPQDKRPLFDWKNYQTNRADGEKITIWFKNQPQANIGIVTGEASGIIVLDVDGEKGLNTLRSRGFQLPPTVTVRTGGGGWHYFFKWPGFECRNFAGGTGETILPGVDFRGDGGYVVAPGSIHPNGSKYEWLIGPGEEKIADAPEWLVELIWNQQGLAGSNGVLPQEWAEAVPAGRRNTTLARLAGSLLTKMEKGDALPMLLAWNRERCSPPLPEGEVRKTVHSIAGREAEKTSGEDWPQPDKLEVELLPVEPLPPALIPEPFQPWIEDVSFRMQAPVDFLAAAAMVVAGSAIGTACRIRPKKYDDWTVTPNLWGAVIADPGFKKSPALLEIMQPLRELEATARRDYEERCRTAELEATVHKAAKEGLISQIRQASKTVHKDNGRRMEQLKMELAELEEEAVVAPVRRRFVTSDSTIEKMGELLQENPRGILTYRDELVGLLATLDREENQSMRAFFLEGWSGDGSFTWDRIGRGTVDTEDMCISILGGIQPSRLLGYLHQAKHDFGNDGLLQRFQLAVYPDNPASFEKARVTDRSPDLAGRARAADIIKALAHMDFHLAGAEQDDDGQTFLRFDHGAQEMFYSWMDDLENRLLARKENPLMLQHLSKFRSLMPSIALIIHLVNVAGGRANGPVGLEAAEKAAAWCKYLESHARRIYAMGGQPQVKAAQALAQKILDGDVGDVFTGRDVYINNWSRLTNSKAVREATDELISAGWLREEVKQTGGRPSTIFRVNPFVYTRG